MKKRNLAIIISLVMAASLAGCSDSSSGDPKSKSSVNSQATANSNNADEAAEDSGSDSRSETADEIGASAQDEERAEFFEELDRQYKEYGTIVGSAESISNLCALKDGYGFVKGTDPASRQAYAYIFNENGDIYDLKPLENGLISKRYDAEDPDEGDQDYVSIYGDFYYYGGDHLCCMRNYEDYVSLGDKAGTFSIHPEDEDAYDSEEYEIFSADEIETHRLLEFDLNGNKVKDITFNDPDTNDDWDIPSRSGSGELYTFGYVRLLGADRDGGMIVSCDMYFKYFDEDAQAEFDQWVKEYPEKAEELLGEIEVDFHYLKKESGLLYIGIDPDVPVRIPDITADVGHGMTDDIDISEAVYMTGYKNKVYFDVDGDHYYLDTNDLSWHEVDAEKGIGSIFIGRYGFYGNNLFGEEKFDGYVYDMETDTYIEGIPFAFEIMCNYFGGDTVIMPVSLNAGDTSTMCQVRLPYGDTDNANSGSIVYSGAALSGYEVVKEFSDEINKTFSTGEPKDYALEQLSNTHYVIRDDYGVFIQSYENGAADEKAVCTFNK